MTPHDQVNSRQGQAASARCLHVPVVQTQELFGSFQEIRIQHRGDEYRLRITRNQKLILTK